MHTISKLTLICSAAFIAGVLAGGPVLGQEEEGESSDIDVGQGEAAIGDTRQHFGATFGPLTGAPFGLTQEQLLDILGEPESPTSKFVFPEGLPDLGPATTDVKPGTAEAKPPPIGQIFVGIEDPEDVDTAGTAVKDAWKVLNEQYKLYSKEFHQWEIEMGWDERFDPETQVWTTVNPLPSGSLYELFNATPVGAGLFATVNDARLGLNLAHEDLAEAQDRAAGRTPAHQGDTDGVDSDIDSVIDELEGIVVLVPGN